MLEFFWSPYSNHLMVHDISKDEINKLTEKNTELIDKVCTILKEDYPDNWNELIADYAKSALPINAETKYKIVNRFLKCNFSVNDNEPDIDDDFNFEFEKVPCPIRDECTKAYCRPKLSNNLTKRECQIVPYLVEGLSHAQIGDILYVSPITIKNHVYKIYLKLGFTGKPHPETLLINYAYKHKIIQPNK